jgi:hypothetical protein
LALLALLALPVPSLGQGLKIAAGDVGLGIGDVPRLDGIRLNFRDRELRKVRGLNATIWGPYQGARGEVRGLALGVPLTGAADMSGLAVGLGVEVERTFTGVGLAPIGFGAGDRIRGIAVGGIGIGGGGELEGLMVGGVGLGVAGDIRGVVVGGVGAGAGGDLEGLAVGGVGIGAGGRVTGVVIGGVGAGASGDVRGIVIGGVGVGAGEDVTGIAVGGVGVGAGGELKGLAIGGVGVGAPRIRGVVLTGVGAGAEDARGFVLAPAYFEIEEGGVMEGVSVSAWNRIRGRQHGVAIGLLNVADELHGLQLGLINIARNKDSFSVLPLVNYHR